MARKRSDQGDKFSFNELAIAGDMSKRSFQHVSDIGLIPAGQGINALKRIAVIGAFVSCGVPLIAAGRIVEKLLWSFNRSDGEMPSGLSVMAAALAHIEDPFIDQQEPNDYWYHRKLYSSPIYKRGQKERADVRVEIADREHVYLRANLASIEALGPSIPDVTYEGWIEDWKRGSEPNFFSLAELTEASVSDALKRALWAHENAVGLLTINVSLAVRNGLDRLADHRNTSEGRSNK